MKVYHIHAKRIMFETILQVTAVILNVAVIFLIFKMSKERQTAEAEFKRQLEEAKKREEILKEELEKIRKDGTL